MPPTDPIDPTDRPSPTDRTGLVDLHGRRIWETLRGSVALAVVGQEAALRLLAVALLAGGHALVEDVPGTGKTLLARAFAASLGLSFGRVQGTPDLLPTDVTGSSILTADGGDTGTGFRFIAGPVFNQVLLVDEINRATPRTQSSLLEAMQEGRVSVDGVTRPLPTPFLVLATQNPVELEGTFALPEAQLDRFLVRVAVGYPTEDGERAIARRYREAAEPLERITPVLQAPEVVALAGPRPGRHRGPGGRGVPGGHRAGDARPSGGPPGGQPAGERGPLPFEPGMGAPGGP